MLTRDERRELARGRPNETRKPAEFADGYQIGQSCPDLSPRRCPYCTARLTSGAPVCDATCDAGWWEVVPTVTGELYGPEAPPASSMTTTTTASSASVDSRTSGSGGSGGRQRCV
jgi:hypothetical protein